MAQPRRLIAALFVVALSGAAAGAQTLADFERIDTNKDGFVSADEFDAARRRDFDLLDANKDGFLSQAEFVQRSGGDPRMRALRERRFREMDINKDGRVSREEYLAYGRRQFAQLDRDGDGRISRAEFEAALAGGSAPPSTATPLERPPEQPPSAGLRPSRPMAPDARAPNPPAAKPPVDQTSLRAAFDRIDRNKDGFITPAELDAARLEAFQEMDTNGDGRLTRDEIVAARGEAAAARFAELDADKDGFVTRREYLEAGRAMFRAADTNGDRRLSFEEFARMVQ